MDKRRVVVLAADSAVGSGVAAGLSGRGVAVLRLADAGDAPAGVSAIVDAGPVAAVPAVADLATLSLDAWQAFAEAPLRRALHVLKAARRCFAGGAGRVVVLLPSLVTTGAAGVVAWAAAGEGYRSLAKAAARGWGPDGITVNCVLIPADLVAGRTLDRPGLQPPALARVPSVHADVTGVVAALVADDLAGVTGQTIAVDGGVWMTP